MITWTPTVLSVLYARVLYFCICTCSAQLSMFHMERHSRNTLIIIIIIECGQIGSLPDFPGSVIPMTEHLVLRWKPCLGPGVVGFVCWLVA